MIHSLRTGQFALGLLALLGLLSAAPHSTLHHAYATEGGALAGSQTLAIQNSAPVGELPGLPRSADAADLATLVPPDHGQAAAGSAVPAKEAQPVESPPVIPDKVISESSVEQPPKRVVFDDYMEAMKEATEDRKLLFIYFYDPTLNAARRAFETLTLADQTIQEQLDRFVVAHLPKDASIQLNGKQQRLLDHPAFAEMLGRQGVAIIDLAHVRAEYYGHVVSTFAFTPGKFYRKEALSIILDLPPGTLTQRTMIYAVRIHPEAPKSTQGQFHTVLADEAKSHSTYQAAIHVQGHHSWDTRFQRISYKLGGHALPQEVVAESWPNENLVEACVDCVHSWRQSPGHWGAVRSRHSVFGYDIKRGRNGIWYATGIFGRR
jgi:hypothetical protein